MAKFGSNLACKLTFDKQFFTLLFSNKAMRVVKVSPILLESYLQIVLKGRSSIFGYLSHLGETITEQIIPGQWLN